MDYLINESNNKISLMATCQCYSGCYGSCKNGCNGCTGCNGCKGSCNGCKGNFML